MQIDVDDNHFTGMTLEYKGDQTAIIEKRFHERFGTPSINDSHVKVWRLPDYQVEMQIFLKKDTASVLVIRFQKLKDSSGKN